MTDRPIIFSAPMIRALLDGRKTQTRRVLKEQRHAATPAMVDGRWQWLGWSGAKLGDVVLRHAPGDRLWVREAWNTFAFSEDGECAWPTDDIPTAKEMREIREAAYRFDVQAVYRESDRARKWFVDLPWRSPIHMPRWASRLTLTVTDVRVQRLQDSTGADAKAEGLTTVTKDGKLWKWGIPDQDGLPGNDDNGWQWVDWSTDPRAAFARLWNSIHGPEAWRANPWVCALTFTVRQGNIDT